jgi:hypothetical protein
MIIHKKSQILHLSNKNSFNSSKEDFKYMRFLEDVYKDSTQVNLGKNSLLDSSKTNIVKEIEKIEITSDAISSEIITEFNNLIPEEFNYTSNLWVLKVQIGEPNQEFSLEIDTTISTTWVPSINCINCLSNERYNASKSMTSRKTNQTIKIEDYLGDLKGEVIYDDFSIISLGIELRNYPFIQAIELQEKYNDPPEGKIAFSNINKYGEKFSFLNALVEKGKISKRVFALEFQEDSKNENRGESKIYFGDLPERMKNLKKKGKFGHCNTTTSEDLKDEFRDGWTCEFSHISFNQKNHVRNLNDSIELENTRVIFDSSYEFIGVSRNQYELIYENYIKQNFMGKCRKNEKNDEISFICNLKKSDFESAGSLYITLQGYVLELKVEDLFVELDKNNNYLFAIKFFDQDDDKSDTKLWLLGHLFLKKFITVFDAEENQVFFYNENIYDIVTDWNKWYNSDYYSLLVSRYFYLAVGSCLVVALFLLFVCFIVFRSFRRKNNRHGPLIDNEIK